MLLLLDHLFQAERSDQKEDEQKIPRNIKPKDAFDVVSENRIVEQDLAVHKEGFGLCHDKLSAKTWESGTGLGWTGDTGDKTPHAENLMYVCH